MHASLKQMLRRSVKRAAIVGGLEASNLMARAGLFGTARGRGVIFTLHHVRPKTPRVFDPNAHLEVTPEFLDIAIDALAHAGYRFLRLDDVPAALSETSGQPFAVFTLDDGYRNNRDHALPVFARHGVPCTVFAAGGYIDRSHSMWWETAAQLLERVERLRFDFGTGPEDIETGSQAQKHAAFSRIAAAILRPDEERHVAALDRLAETAGIDAKGIVADLTMNADELNAFAGHPLVTLGAHTISHKALGLLNEREAEAEMLRSADRIEAITGKRPASIAYPYGDARAATARDFALAARLGFAVGVTTQPGTLHSGQPPTALPRVSLNGFYQTRRYVGALASGIPFWLMG